MARAARSIERVPMFVRLSWTIGLLAALAIGYLAAGNAGVMPLPRSIGSLSGSGGAGHGYALVIGNYIAMPFVANGNGLPPYVFGDWANSGNGHASAGPVVYVNPSLADLRAYRVVAVVDAATGNGTEWSPYQIQTVGSVNAVVAVVLIGALVLLALLFWIAGYAALLLQPRSLQALRHNG